jgi:sortase A
MIGLGALVLAFVAYQLWGTRLAESHSQDVLRHQLSGRLATGPPTTSAPESPPPVASRPAAPSPPAEGGAVGIITIPKLGLDKAIIEGTGPADLRQGPGHYRGTPLPGQSGNASIAAHRTTYGAPFYRLNDLVPGDQIMVTTSQGMFRYDVARSLVVEPSNVSVIAPTVTDDLTLTTCTPRYSATRRLIVQASLIGPPVPAASLPAGPSRVIPTLAGDTGSWLPLVAWGLLTAATAVGIWLAARLGRGRWLVYVLGMPAFLAVLFFFFAAVSKVLPASI